MKISIDGQVFFEEQKTGIGLLAHNVLCNLPVDNQKDEMQLNCFIMGSNRKRQHLVDQYHKYGIHTKKVGWFHGGIYSRIWDKIPIPYWLFFGRDSDITIFFNYIIPPGVKGKKVAFVHDMAYMAYPQTIQKTTRDILQASMEKTCRIADRIITISQFSKSEIVKYMGVDEGKIDVISLGVDRNYFHPDYEKTEIRQVKEKYKIRGDYFFYQGTLEPRKNLERLIRAYGILCQKNSEIPALVLAGKKGWLYEDIFRAVMELHLEDKVIFPGYIESADIPKLMKGAIAFVFPSLYEGFGLPPLEAMACGTPVIASGVASIPEVTGEAALLVDPLDIENIADALQKMIEEPRLREHLSQTAREQSAKFSWEQSAKQVIAIIDKMK